MPTAVGSATCESVTAKLMLFAFDVSNSLSPCFSATALSASVGTGTLAARAFGAFFHPGAPISRNVTKRSSWTHAGPSRIILSNARDFVRPGNDRAPQEPLDFCQWTEQTHPRVQRDSLVHGVTTLAVNEPIRVVDGVPASVLADLCDGLNIVICTGAKQLVVESTQRIFSLPSSSIFARRASRSVRTTSSKFRRRHLPS